MRAGENDRSTVNNANVFDLILKSVLKKEIYSVYVDTLDHV